MAQDKQQVLITGATGFIGRHLCDDLRRQGASVIALTRDVRRARKRLGGDIEAVEKLADIPADRPVEAVVNLAGENLMSGPWTERRKRRFVDSRVGTTQRLVDWIGERERRPSVLVSGSAIGYYGRQECHILQEFDEPRPNFSHYLCERWEQTAQQAEDMGLRVCRLRTGLVLGTDGGVLKRMLPAFKLGLGCRLGSGEQWMSWIHIDDIVRLIQFLIGHDTLTGPFNGTAPTPVTNAEFTETLARELRRPVLFSAPAFVLRLTAGELADELLLASQRVVPAAAQEAGFEFRYPRLQPALADLL